MALASKRAPRQASNFTAYRDRLDRSEAGRVAYLCNEGSGRAVHTALEVTPQGRGIAGRIAVRIVFDGRARLRNLNQLLVR